MRRPALYIGGFAVAILALTAAGYAAYWYSAAGKVRDGIARWALERRAAGWQVDLATPEIGGFPFRIDVRIASAKLAGPGAPARWSWTLPPVHARAKPWSPRRVHVSAPGRHEVGAGAQAFVVDASRADADLVAGDRSLRAGEVRLAGIDIRRAADDARLAVGAMRLRLDRRTLPAPQSGDAEGTARPETGLGVALSADKIALPDIWKPPLGTLVDRISLDAVVTGRFEPRGPLPEALARWRDSGGAVEVQSFAVDWRSLRLRAQGTFALDDELQPEGATTAEIDGIDKTADALIDAGVIDRNAALSAKVANRALTLGGGPARLPITVQERKLFLGPVPLITLKKISWN